jgi:hypothetical protein
MAPTRRCGARLVGLLRMFWDTSRLGTVFFCGAIKIAALGRAREDGEELLPHAFAWPERDSKKP